MPNTIPAAGEAMPSRKAVADCIEDMVHIRAVVKTSWLALTSPNFDVSDVSDVASNLASILETVEKCCATTYEANEAEIAAISEREA